jgi:hypothetical protein
MTDDADAPEVVASVGELDAVVVLLREFLHRSGALRAVALVDGPPGDGPAVVDCARFAPIEVEAGGRTVHVPHGAALDAPAPELPALRQLPPFEVNVARAEIGAPPGAVAHVAEAVRALAELLGGRNVTATAMRAATDKEIQENLKKAVDELRTAANRIQGKEDHGARNTMLLLAGITAGILFNPMTGPQTRSWLMEKITGESSDDYSYTPPSSGTSSSDNGS